MDLQNFLFCLFTICVCLPHLSNTKSLLLCMLTIQSPIYEIANSNSIVKYLEEEDQERQAWTEVKVPLWEAEDPQNLALGLNHHLGVSDGPSQNRLKARVSLDEMLIVMMKIMFTGQLSVRVYSSKCS